MKRASRWIVFLPVAFFALFPQQVSAEPQQGLNAVGYYIDDLPPTRSDDVYTSCGSEIENNINRNFNGEPFQNCGWDYFMVHYSGFINIPEHDTIQFMVAADDGGTVSIAGQEFGTWNLKGCAWSQSITLSVMPGSYPLDGWFFEWWGGTCYMLAWKIDDNYWEIVPEWAFTTASTPTTTTTTTTVPLETVPATDPTTTTLQETSTTTTQETTTTLPETTTTSTLPPSTSTTQAWVPPPTSTTSEPSTTVVETTTTTELPPQPTTTLVVQTSTSSSVVKTTTTTAASTTTSEPVVTTTNPEVTASTAQQVVQELPEPPQPNEPVSQAQAMSIALNPQVLATVSSDQAEAVFAALSVSELSNTELAALVEAVQEAPTEVRAAFEKEINIFGEGLDNYVPLGSNIPVGTRRTLIAVTAGITLAAAGTRMRK